MPAAPTGKSAFNTYRAREGAQRGPIRASLCAPFVSCFSLPASGGTRRKCRHGKYSSLRIIHYRKDLYRYDSYTRNYDRKPAGTTGGTKQKRLAAALATVGPGRCHAHLDLHELLPTGTERLRQPVLCRCDQE